MLRRVVGPAVVVGLPASFYAVEQNPGAKRSVQFWMTILPTVLEYQSIKGVAWMRGEEGAREGAKSRRGQGRTF